MEEKLLRWDEILKPGTPFWPISYYNREKRVKCHVCKGKGVIELEGKTYDCPECFGRGYNTEIEPSQWHICENWATDYWVVTRVDISQSEEADKYDVMYWHQGNGFRASKVFTSRNLAKRACNKLNKEVAEK